MSWRERLQQASFKGVPFFVDSHEFTLGRRVQVHEFPLRDLPFAEDLGRKARTVSLTAYVLGTGYMALRDRLLQVLELGGAGALQHPYLGELRATVLSCKLSESSAEGGLARFALELVEAGESRFPVESTKTEAAVAAAADHATDALVANLNRQFAVLRKPAFVAAAAGSIFGDALAKVIGAVGLVRGVADEVAALQRDVDAARRDLTTLIYTPGAAAQALVSNIRQLVRSVASAPADALSLARTLYRFGDRQPAVLANTTSRRAQATNQAELVQLVRVVAAAEGARAVSTVAFDSFQDATAARDELLDVLDGVMLASGLSDEAYDALRGLRAAVVRDVAARGAALVRLAAWVPAATAPSLALAQRLYSDALQEPELVARNAIRHPLFVAGGLALEVLSNGA